MQYKGRKFVGCLKCNPDFIVTFQSTLLCSPMNGFAFFGNKLYFLEERPLTSKVMILADMHTQEHNEKNIIKIQKCVLKHKMKIIHYMPAHNKFPTAKAMMANCGKKEQAKQLRMCLASPVSLMRPKECLLDLAIWLGHTMWHRFWVGLRSLYEALSISGAFPECLEGLHCWCLCVLLLALLVSCLSFFHFTEGLGAGGAWHSAA